MFLLAPEVYMPNTACFSYPADVPPAPPGLRRMPVTSTCFRYPGDVPPGLRQMPASSTCFKYQGDVPPGLRQMPGTVTCFRY
jgi:hypothetical protein